MGEVVLQTTWGVPIALYLFLGGLAAGTLVVTGLLYLKKGEDFAKTVRFGAWAGTICLIAGVGCLILEVSEPLRAVQLWSAFVNPTSLMTVGAWFLFAGIAVFGIYALASVIPAWKGLLKPWSYLVIAVGIGIAAYTGILLGVLKAHPLWNTALLPCLFTVSALDTGVALVAIYLALAEKAEGKDAVQHTVEKAVFVLVVLEIIVLIAYLLVVGLSSSAGAASVGILVSGPLAIPFWALFVVLGLLAPLAFAVLNLKGKKFPAWAPALAAACALIGGCALRFLVLYAGVSVWM